MAGINCLSLVSSIFDAIRFGWVNMENLLPKEMEELKRARAETARAIETAEVRGAVRRTDQVKSWLEQVDAIDGAVQELVNALHDTTISGPGYLRQRCQLGDLLRGVLELKSLRASFTVLTLPGGMQEAFSAVKEHLRDDKVAIIGIHGLGGLGKSTLLQYLSSEFTGRPAATGEDAPVNFKAASTPGEDPRPLANVEATLSKVRDFLIKDGDRVRVIGVFGSAGVGKTTLLRKIRDEFRTGGSRRVFDMVIYTTVSRHESIRRLRLDLAAAIGLDINVSSPSAKKPHGDSIRAALSEKRVLLLLDNVRENPDFASAGLLPVDDHDYRSWIVFTTASPDVCEAMGAQETVTLGLLDEKQSWELFRREAGIDAALQDPSIVEFAQQMAKRCGGRPVALVTVARAMVDKQLPVEWSHALRALEEIMENSKRHDTGMNLETSPLFSPLKFSYDFLGDDKLRTCLLYCALFPEGHGIDREQLVEYWIGEGLLDFGEPAGLYVARNRGHMIIRSLESAGLLQSGSTDGEKYVELHEAVRDVALWITSGNSDEEERFLVDEQRAELWSSATRVSLPMQEKAEKLPDDVPTCPKLSTLLIHGRHTQQTPAGPKLVECRISVSTGDFSTFLPVSICSFFPAFRVLDLFRTPLDNLPRTIGLLCELQYLNLSHTGISSLPGELGNLTKLRQLDLRHTEQLKFIPAEAISSLKALQLLNLYGSGFLWLPSTDKSVKMKDLEPFDNLTELGVSLGDLVPFGNLQNNTRLRRAVRFLNLSQVNGLISNSLSSALAGWSRLRELKLEECPQLEEFIIENNQLLFLQVLQLDHLSHLSTVKLGNGDPGTGGAHASTPLRRLSHLYINHCDMLKALGWVGHLPRLEEIHVDHCNSMTQLLTGGISGGGGLPRLRRLRLENLRRLTDISEVSSLRFPSLEDMTVENCPMLPPASILESRLLNCK